MRQLKLLLAAIALLWAMPCWGKPIDLHGKWEHKKKSIPIGLPMDASIEEANRELIVNFHEDLGDVCVIVTSSTGEVIYNEKVQTSTMPYLVIPLKVRDQEKGVLHIMNDYNHVFGGFLNLNFCIVNDIGCKKYNFLLFYLLKSSIMKKVYLYLFA